METFETQVTAHLNALPKQLTTALKERFREEHIVQIDHLLPQTLAAELHDQARRLTEESAKRRDLELAATGGTPRAYLSVDRNTVRADDGVITALFESEAVREYVTDLAGETLHRVPYEPEEYIINTQERSGDTHGWHWDDYTFALIWVVEAPGPFEGGRVEYVTRTLWDKDQPRRQLEDLLQEREVRSRYIPAGSCYLMRANTTLHRVAPLIGNTRRMVVVFTYASDADLSDHSISHETMESIYAPELAA